MIQAVPSITAKMKRNCCWQLRNSFFIDAHEILWSTLECIEADVYIKAAMKKSPLMQVILLANMRIEVAFYQDPSMNGINLKNVCRYCKKNVCKDPDEDYEGFLSSFATLEDAMLSLPMACYYHRLKSVVMFGTKKCKARKFIRNMLLYPLSKEEEESYFDHIRLCSPHQCKFDSCFGDDQYIVCVETEMRQLINFLLTSSKTGIIN